MKLILPIRGIKVLKISFIFVLILQLTFSIFVFQPPKAHAAALTALSDVMSRQKKSVNSNHTITFTTPTGVTSPGVMLIRFPSDFSLLSVDYTDVDITDDGTDLTLGSIPSGAQWGVLMDTLYFTIISGTGTIAAGSVIVIEIGTHATEGTTGDQQIDNASTAGSYTITVDITLGTDVGKIGVVILNDDQVGVTATVDPTLSFSISDITVGFGSFVSTNIRYATGDVAGSASEPAADNPTKLVVSTNGDNGATITVQDEGSGSSSGLWSAAPISELIASDTSRNIIVVGNKKKYGLYGKNASTLVIHENFDNDATDSALTRAAQTFASYTGPMSSASLDLVPVAAVDATTKAGNYTDTITIICTGNF